MKKNFTSKLLALMALPSFFILNAQCNPVNVPYLEDFNSTPFDSIPTCTSQDAGGNFTVADFDSPGLLGEITESNTNAWFFTKAINLQAGTSYTVSFKHIEADLNATLKIAYGNSASPSSMINATSITPNTTDVGLLPATYTFTPASSGVYYVGFDLLATNATDNDPSLVVIDDISVTQNVLSTSEVIEKRDVSIYPNPATDYLIVQSKRKISGAEIFDISGRKVMSSDKADKINVSALIKGSYILNVKNTDGTSTSHKFIKK
ncbi:Por secretion system C-terminal sorting domain-containing protein [Chryseobacterium sp. RU37D]|uniref:T9SS type A sorting domain-containing protein n=1 Tax=Chryseobacterium sp. RU37D TaxID=1907397 RepID=UPI000954A764|nr:T9SS type A sorting domain-containing protein [Chryseobacterium sp. RU37D]SIQ70090.1 Por secretion system C-terminal sorting domain-containing protein [Chryseobacterium sp. RU37D]